MALNLSGLEDAIQKMLPFAQLGGFVVVWSALELTLEVFIWKKTGMSAEHAHILLSGLGFERKASVARSLMSLEDAKYGTARALLNRIVNEAERNHLIHGQIVGPYENAFALAKRDTSQEDEGEGQTVR